MSVQLLIDKLNLARYFPDVDRSLLRLAITPKGKPLPADISDELEAKYQIGKNKKNYEALEFYGDTLLSILLVDRFKYYYGLDINPSDLHDLKSEIAKNETLTYFSRELDICRSVLEIPDDEDLAKHNICADVFEAIIGVLYYQYGLTNINHIRKWFLSLPPVTKFFDQETAKMYKKRQESLINLNYVNKLKWNKNDSVKNFLLEYFKINTDTELLERYNYDDMYDYYIYNPRYDRRFYIDTVPKGYIEELRQALKDKKIWV